MILGGLKGGQGKQLFQYALGQRTAIDYHCELALDYRALKSNQLRKFALNQFQITQNLANPFSYLLHGFPKLLNPRLA